ncbi:MAG TPA: glycosyltransferase [Terriglobales bacterium]|nr:glycosyltransferase [Terriglobales bacterium]
MKTPKVSVLMSVCNGERFVAEAVESILNQSFCDFELIIVDDGSTDSSGAIVESYLDKDSRLRVYHQGNLGLVESLNRGGSLARGKYIARMDADDVSIRDRLMRQVDFMEKYPAIAVVGGAVDIIDQNGKLLQTARNPVQDYEIKSALLRGECPFWHPTVLMRADVFVSVGGYRNIVVGAEDHDLWLRIADHYQLGNLDSVVLKYRLHPGQVTVRKSKQHALSALAAQAAARVRRNGSPDPLDSMKEITPTVLAGLGVSEAALHSTLATRFLRSIRTMCDSSQYSAALEVLHEMWRTHEWRYIDKYAERRVAADLRLLAARVLWHQRKYAISLLNASCAFISRPMVVLRPLRTLLHWLQLQGRNFYHKTT